LSEAAANGKHLRSWLRALLAGPLVLVAACMLMAGGAVWLPPGQAQVNNLVLPIVLFPLLWTALFLYACLDTRMQRAYAVICTLIASNAALVAWHLFG